MSDELQYWLVSQKGVNWETRLEFVAKGEWVSRNVREHKKNLEEMRVGERIALKNNSRRKWGVPFFNADQSVGLMTLLATGTVRSVDPDSGRIEVDWVAEEEPREWYLWTYAKNLSRIVPDGGARSNLIDWLFHDGDQDIESILPWWPDYPKQPGFTWIAWFEEFATKLASFRQDRGALVQLIETLASEEPTLNIYLGDRFADGSVGPMRDVDPFSVIAGFNRGLTDENRQRIARRFGEALGMTSPLPEDFDGVPLVNNQSTWFIRYDKDRVPGDIDALWRVFAAALALAGQDDEAARTAFVAAFDGAEQIFGIKWNLTMGLFWIRPNAFPTFDGRSREYNLEHLGIGSSLDGSEYLQIRDELQERMSRGDTSLTSFPLLSYAAWAEGTTKWPEHDMAGFASWGVRLAEAIDLDATEHDDKRQTAGLVSQMMNQIQAGEDTWPQTFDQVLKSTNTLNFRFKDDVKQAVANAPDQMARLLAQFGETEDLKAFDQLEEGLVGLLGKATPGNATALGAILALGADPENNAPYGKTRVDKWHRLTGTNAPDVTASPSQRYADMKAWLTDLTEKLASPLGDHLSLLEAQGIAWATTEHDIPDFWSDAESTALTKWRAYEGGMPRAWLIRTQEFEASDWTDGSYVALAATNLTDVPAGADKKTVKKAVDSGYQHLDYAQQQILTAEFYAFLSQMKPGDLVAVPDDDNVHIGEIEGDPTYHEDGADRLRRRVRWLVEVQQTDALTELLESKGTLVDATHERDLLSSLIHDSTPSQPDIPSKSATSSSHSTRPTLPGVTAELAKQLHTDQEELQEILDLLQERQQVVLYGPPGTGKTYLAMALARHAVGQQDRSRVQLVQFHPSYAYEDFFEGFRPKETSEGQATFELTPGPLRQIVSAARENPDSPYVLVIDELNRANLAKVFGELYFLLEYRNEAINLQYNPTEAFRLPKNLFFIATMNTADRSIALLDAAMRRRFSFVELHPDEKPVSDLLSNWLAEQGHSDERALLLAALNSAIEDQDRDLRIGPSYLMREEAATDEGLARIWKYDIMPLLEEHYYGRLTRDQIHDKFGLDALRRSLTDPEPAAD